MLSPSPAAVSPLSPMLSYIYAIARFLEECFGLFLVEHAMACFSCFSGIPKSPGKHISISFQEQL